MSRTDDIINVAGHRLSTGGIEGAIAAHPDVAECAVIGVNDELKGALPLGLIVLKAGVTRDHDEIVREVIALVREEIGPVASFKKAVGGGAAAQDALRQGAARHDEAHRRRHRMAHAGHDRRPDDPG